MRVTGQDDYPTNTFVTRTGSGGVHIWYRLPYQGELRGKAGEGIDIKARRGYLVMPGSVHHKTGRFYQVETWKQPTQWPVLPTCWRKHVYKPVKPKRTPMPINIRRKGNGAGLIRFVADLQEGNRNAALHWAACRAVENDLNIFDELHDAALACGLDTPEITRTINSAKNTATRKAA